MRRFLMVGPVLVLALGALVGCGGSDSGGSELPSAGGTPTASTSASAAPSGEYAQALAFAKCMRENGLPDFPDPAPDGSLNAGDANVDRDSTQYKNAIEACQDLRPGGADTTETDPEQLAQMTKYAKCMRENGVPDFADPGPEGFDPGSFDTKDPSFAAAAKACQEFLTWR